jgi:hypothetical protein
MGQTSRDKVNQFYDTSRHILENVTHEVMQISNEASTEESLRKWFVTGSKMLFEKDAFTETPEATYIDFDSFLAHFVASRLRKGVAETFVLNKSKKYLLKKEDIFKAISKIGLSDYMIICFGVDLNYYIQHLKIPNLTEEKYKENPIILLDGNEVLNSVFFIIRKEDLPFLSSNPVDEDLITEYSLERISDNYNFYASVIDLNLASPEFRNEHSSGKTDEELRKSVLLNINFIIEIGWKRNVNLIRIEEFSEYINKGLPNDLNDVSPIKN